MPNLALVVISYEIYETRQGLVSYMSTEMTTRVRSSIPQIGVVYSKFRIFAFDDNMPVGLQAFLSLTICSLFSNEMQTKVTVFVLYIVFLPHIKVSDHQLP